jgi:hypothetical protein
VSVYSTHPSVVVKVTAGWNAADVC